MNFKNFSIRIFSVFSGGTEFSVHGKHMDVVQVPRLIFYLSHMSNRQKRQGLLMVTEVFTNVSNICFLSDSAVTISVQYYSIMLYPLLGNHNFPLNL